MTVDEPSLAAHLVMPAPTEKIEELTADSAGDDITDIKMSSSDVSVGLVQPVKSSVTPPELRYGDQTSHSSVVCSLPDQPTLDIPPGTQEHTSESEPVSVGAPEPLDTLLSSSPARLSDDHSGASSQPALLHSSPMNTPMPPSSPWTEYDATGSAEPSVVEHDAPGHGHPARTMSSPPPISHCGDFGLSPPRRAVGYRKRVASDDTDEDPPSRGDAKRPRINETKSSPPRCSPAPKRATLASQSLSRRKLVAPFRSPLLTKVATTVSTDPTSGESAAQDAKGQPWQHIITSKAIPNTMKTPGTNPQKTTTALALSSRAAAQFRPPLVRTLKDTNSTPILPNQTIVSLERKLAALKRAVKIKHDSDAGNLGDIFQKWQEAGREAAYELWGIVRDLNTEGGDGPSNGGFNSGWGWEDEVKENVPEEESSYAEDREAAAKQEHTLGVMLRQLGIAPETLGWSEEQETFVDE
ncbi:hypothetical protein BC834DRAFT_967846 [Gloeopeniophorella convolvens]|nr:hypothetical protein BC834DRAFT_967846 [Gloeopeniophorella convolvens]